ncbi:polysaccharide lyase family 8 protein [Amylostereum chailletii]|nr:polysaccharide lyase family 8 protein [Amylostereum chailletii]
MAPPLTSSVRNPPSHTSALSPSTSVPTAIVLGPETLNDLHSVLTSRLSFITVGAGNATDISGWLSTLGPDGRWPDSEVDYTTGCPARRANWPAQEHWIRILTMSAAWHGGLPDADPYVKSTSMADSISTAMNFWFDQDFTLPGCLDEGGTSDCPCGSPGLWNTNWFSNVILIPRLVGESCLLFNASLTESQVDSCNTFTSRSYDRFYAVPPPGYLSGANILDIAKIGIDNSLLTSNGTLIAEAYERIHSEVVIEPGIMVDGIKPDGSFGQHAGLLYNGNYGKDYSNDVLELEIDAGGTQYAANTSAQAAFETLIDGDQWMIYRNVLTGVLHWDFSALPRFITFPVIDGQATAGLDINLTEIQTLGELWGSSVMQNVHASLSKPTVDANTGELKGNRNFPNNDYMVHRGDGYISTFKMYSSRTRNTECTNSQNPLGFHLADGTLYTYLKGNEYEDIAAAWDWNLIPGTTVDYQATPLNCNNASWTGAQSFVGGVSTGSTGVAAMRYTNPYTHSLNWQKAVFFLDDDTQFVMISNLSSLSSAPVYTVLDQKRHDGPIYLDGRSVHLESGSVLRTTFSSSLWHSGVGYKFEEPFTALGIMSGNQTGNWTAIGASLQPPETVDLFAAYIEHHNVSRPVSYMAFPGTDPDAFQSKSARRNVRNVQNDAHISAVYDVDHGKLAAVFWDAEGGLLQFVPEAWQGVVSVRSSGNAAILLDLQGNNLTVSDPSQMLPGLEIDVMLGTWAKTQTVWIDLPSGGNAGSSVSYQL